MRRSILRQKERWQLSYELPHEAFRSHVYPRQSSNGSTVVVYGHEQGLRLVWYAGKGFKPPKKDLPTPKINGTAKTDPMVIDIDDEDEDTPGSAETETRPAEFKQDEEEVDPSAPYRDVLRHIDIPLGTAASRIAVPYIVKDLAQAPPESWPAIYNDRIIVAAACTDLSIRVISTPLDPPAPEVHDVSRMDVQILKIEGPNSHQQFVSDVAITHTGVVLKEQEDVEEPTQARPQTRSQSQSKRETAEAESVHWSLLVASISCTGAGLLLVHQLPLQKNQLAPNADYAHPIRRTYLRSSSMNARVSFNTSPYPAERHSTLLITLPADSTVKVYQVFPSRTRERRGSTATSDSVSSTRSSRFLTNDRGKFLITMLPSFRPENMEVVQQRRKAVLDARWLIAGRAVATLLEDGEWGIWDLEAVGPTSSSSGANLLRGHGNISGIQGGSLTRFAIRSHIFPAVESKQKSSHAEAQPTSGSLAPMTPSTRKVRSAGLFQGSKLTNNALKSNNQRCHGSIYVEERLPNRVAHDESVLISYADETIYVPSILSFWKGESKPIRLPPARLGGQVPLSISLLPSSESSNSMFSGTSIFDNALLSPPDLLIQTSHRLILSLNPLSSRSSAVDPSSQTIAAPSDQALLASGNLDVEGMDRLLDDMGGVGATKKPMNLFTKSVGFRIDDDDGDEDIDMGSPTPAKGRGLRIPNGKKVLEGESAVPQRRLFT
ncbi:uncharacterized protein Z519_10047 [Cladophialophora bantiana CBS 173.52]|uniref:BCAS3 domain-containing protein n=1 Tax=Cladophialophora bantiana (strain ATCC 10958 / CBS 173.52 / CDC B-1940 / NIH 8579) TaxID=1442370 RepID=A0A0D2HEE4_CLAB1|nr:uncharacterized protein Z519_10047 [Cladophialophora bantiana CBS 173.52]KIW89195.1 hypothetical protein Z519_10047 [Cladophialophora bantiana CBS 173.52]